MSNLPNILIFNPDQWRGDVLGHLGNPAAVTPNVDRLVETEAVSFSQAFCQNPVCTPSRCSFMTGWYPHVAGHRTMHHMLQPHEPMLLRTLKQAGYYVWWGGKNDIIPAQYGFEDHCDYKHPYPTRPTWTNLHAYDSWRGSPESDTFYSFYYGCIHKPEDFPDEPFVYDDDWHNVLGAVDFIRNWPTNKQPKSKHAFCIFLPLGSPHPPYAVEDPWYSQINRSLLPRRIPTPEDWSGKPSLLEGIYERQGLHTWDESRWTELRATYYGQCARTDHQFGLILKALQDTHLYDNTAIFFFADHGDFTGDYGLVEKTQNTFEDCLVHVPFIIKPPKEIPVQPGINHALVELVDFPATVEHIANIQPGHTHFGRSLIPLLSGETTTHRDAVFCEGGRIHGETHAMEPIDPQHGQNWLYWPRLSLQHSEGAEHSKAVMCRTSQYKYVLRLYESDELYDLVSDPGELHNLVYEPNLADVRTALKDRILKFFLETGDVVPFKEDRRY